MRICHLVNFAIPLKGKIKERENKRKQKDIQILGPCQRTEKAMEHECQGNTNYCWCTQNHP